MAERRLHGLQRVLGVNALFSTAYATGHVEKARDGFVLAERPCRVIIEADGGHG